MKVQNGDSVAVHYTGKLDSGEVFDSSEGGEPLRFRVGSGQVIPGFDTAVMGLEKGESRTVRIPPEQAYGVKRQELILKLDREMFGENDVEVGQHLDLEDDKGNTHHADVVAVDEAHVTVDMNHHLAGEALTFVVRVEEIQRSA